MLDRASTFAQPEIVKLLQSQFIPVAIDQANQRRQQDAEGEFYRKIASQGPRNDFAGTTQGFYIATPSGKLLLYNNNRDPEKLLGLMQAKLQVWQSEREPASELTESPASDDRTERDQRFAFDPPSGGLIVRAHTKILGGYPQTDDRWRKIFQSALARDNLWVTAEEQSQMVAGKIPQSLQRRIARFHLVDNTRGEPAMWSDEELDQVDLQIEQGKLTGTFKLKTAAGERGFEGKFLGHMKTEAGKVVAFELVALGKHWGEGPYTKGAPVGKFPLAVALTLADGSDLADGVAPQGARGWLAGYLE